MVSKPLACASWTILATLLAGCASETAAPPDAPGCTSVVAEGLTTDHASTGGASWSDYDGDGDLDLLVTNGYDVSSAEPSGQPNRLYRNEGGGAFTEITAGALAESAGFSSGSTWGDYDGDADLYVGNWPNEPGPGELNALYRNESGGHWLRVRLEGGAIGARVVLTSLREGETITQMREVVAQSGFRGQSDLSPHFGLGASTGIVSLEVRWPSGEVSRLTDVPGDGIVEVVEPDQS